MALYQVSAGDRILAADINQFYSILKGVAASGEAVTLIYNAAGSVILQPSSDPAAGTEVLQIKNAASVVQGSLTFDGKHKAADGSTTVAGFAFQGDVNTGFIRNAADDFSAITGGTDRLRIDTATITTTLPVIAPAATTSIPSVRFPHGAAPSAPTNGDVWTTSAGIFVRVNGATVGPLAGGAGINIATEQATTSGTSVDFTGIPSTAKRITVMLNGVSTNGTSRVQLQLGDSGGVEVSGYNGARNGVAAASALSAGFEHGSAAATAVRYGQFILSLEDSSDNTWTCTWIIADSAAPSTDYGAGAKATSAVLDRVRLTTVNGTDAFDAGVMSISYE